MKKFFIKKIMVTKNRKDKKVEEHLHKVKIANIYNLVVIFFLLVACALFLYTIIPKKSKN